MNLYGRLSILAKKLNEKHFGVLIEAMGPDGKWQKLDASTIDDEGVGLPLKAMQIIGNTVTVDTQTGEDVIARNPNITISNKCLSPFPVAGEIWLFKIPVSQDDGAPMRDYQMSTDKVFTEDVLGVTKIYLMDVEQKTA